MPHIVTYTKILRVDNLNIWRDENDEIKVNINVRLATDDGKTDRYSKIFDLKPEAEAALLSFVKSRIKELGIELDIEIPDWANS